MFNMNSNFKIRAICLLFFGLFCLSISGTSADRSRNSRQNTPNTMFSRLNIRRTMDDLNEARQNRRLVTDLDNFRNLFVLVRHAMLGLTDLNEITRQNQQHGKMQRRIPLNEPFPCNVTHGRSANTPNSVNELRPGDIDVVASIGDSLSAGNGVVSETLGHILNEVRGITFSGGGLSTWRKYLTLPNILKVYNPHLYGYSTGNGLTVDHSSRLNIAEPMVMSRDLPYQVRTVIDRMRRDPRIDMQRNWKVLTIFVGNNDICSDSCHYDNIDVFLQRHEIDLRKALTILRENVPRMLVNILPVPNLVRTLYPMNNLPLICTVVHLVGCHCIFSDGIGPEKLQKLSHDIARWQQIDERVAYSPEFQTDDFAVIYHPFITNISAPKTPKGNTDLRYFASDCFHFSQLGQATIANALWNSMLQPIGRKQANIRRAFLHFECPTEQRPYIATLKNSQTIQT